VKLRNGLSLFWAFCLGASFSTVAQDFDPGQSPYTFDMPLGLFEMSGLAVASETSVFTHNDEHGIIYEVSIIDGEILRIFALGDPTIAADFEGIEVSQDRVYLITSKGILYEASIGYHQSRVKFNGELSFLILCKSPRQPELKDRLTIYKWNLSERRPVTEPWLSIDRDDLLLQSEQKRFKPAGLDWQTDTGRLSIISGGNRQLLLLNKDGEKIANYVLAKRHHPQTEGLAIMPNGTFVFADEGTRTQDGRLSVYKTSP